VPNKANHLKGWDAKPPVLSTVIIVQDSGVTGAVFQRPLVSNKMWGRFFVLVFRVGNKKRISITGNRLVVECLKADIQLAGKVSSDGCSRTDNDNAEST
jgi:hypothetical protein